MPTLPNLCIVGKLDCLQKEVILLQSHFSDESWRDFLFSSQTVVSLVDASGDQAGRIGLLNYYRPQRSWGKVMFLQASVILLTGGGACVVPRGGVRGFIRGGGRVWFYSGGHAWFYSGGRAWFYLGGRAWFYSGGRAWFYSGGRAWFYSGGCVVLFRGGHAWFYSGGGVRGFIQGGRAWFCSEGGACVVLLGRGGVCVVLFRGGACVVFPVFADTMRYGQWAGGTHPTGMHSCVMRFSVLNVSL